MSDLSDFLASECDGMTVQQAFSHARAQTVDVDGIAQSGYVMAYLAQAGKYTLLEDMANDRSHAGYADLSAVPGLTADYLYGVIKTAMQTLSTREGFDFRLAGVNSTMGLLVALGILSVDDQVAIRAIGANSEPRFSGLTMKQVVEVMEPSLAGPGESNIIDIVSKKSRAHWIVVTLEQTLPEPVNLQFRVRNKYGETWGEWEGSSIVGLTNKQRAAVYSARLPGELIRSDEAQIKIICPYNVPITLLVESV
jgi:hypothetical protein